MIAKLDMFSAWIPNLFESYLRIDFLNSKAAREAIVKPIEQYNRLRANDEKAVIIEKSLVEAVLRQVRSEQDVLMAGEQTIDDDWERIVRIAPPLLQIVMTRLWDEEMQAGSQILRLQTLADMGGAERIVRENLDRVMIGLTPNEQRTAAEVFRYLITPSGVKLAFSASDLAAYIDLPERQLVHVLEKLSGGSARILRPIPPPPDKPDTLRYEIFHDMLVPAILNWRARFPQSRQHTVRRWKKTLSRLFRFN